MKSDIEPKRKFSIPIWGLYPLLIAAYPALALLAENLGQVNSTAAVRTVIVSMLLVVGVAATLGAASGDYSKGALAASGAWLAIASYGHLYGFLKNLTVGDFILGRHRFLAPMAIFLAIAWCIWIIRRPGISAEIARVLTVAGFAAVLLPTISVIRYHLPDQAPGNPDTVAEFSIEPLSAPANGQSHPDIYYIVLDAYGREDVLEQYYGYDNSDFVQFLEAEGFYVASESRSNYVGTVFSLASALNMDYLTGPEGPVFVDSLTTREVAGSIANSRVRSILSELGYRTISFENGHPLTDIDDADLFLEAGDSYELSYFMFADLNSFEGLFLETTIALPLLERYRSNLNSEGELLAAPYEEHRRRIHFILEELSKMPARPGPKFVVAHMIIPHPPFVFGRNGESMNPQQPFSFSDGSSFVGSREGYIEGFRDQTHYLNGLLMDVIHDLIDHSQAPPIIIIQGDHGPRSQVIWDDLEKTDMVEAFGTLNAYYLPGSTGELLHPSISPVNSFRVVFNEYFGTNLRLLDDRSYFSESETAFEFVDVTGRANPSK